MMEVILFFFVMFKRVMFSLELMLMKKLVIFLVGSVCVFFLLFGIVVVEDKELVFMNWGLYINSGILE